MIIPRYSKFMSNQSTLTLLISELPLLRLGFRPFFLGAGIYAVISVLIWMGFYVFGVEFTFNGISATLWHAHEMIFGYTLAIMAGFLLTATQNWTEIRMPHGYPLLGLWVLWMLARLVPFTGGYLPLELMAAFDILFLISLFISVAQPILRVRQWRQSLVLVILLLLLISNSAFYAGLLYGRPVLMYRGIYSGFYLLIALIIFMGGRVIPFFIERGVGYPVKLKNRPWLNNASIGLFLVFWLAEVFLDLPAVSSGLAAVLAVLHGIRLAGWHTQGIWKKPLLWILFLAYAALIAGFVLQAMIVVLDISPFLALHAFGYAGVGWITLGMICRIIWGHTGRNIAEPPRQLPWVFGALILGAVFRVGVPLFETSHYVLWIGFSQLCWILAFGHFLWIYTPVLIQPRPDGRDG